MYVKAEKTLPDYFVDIIGDELNVKKVDFTEDVSAFTTYTFKPQLRTVGPKYGKFLGGIQKALASLDGNAAMAQLAAEGALTLPEVDDSIRLTEDDLLITMTQMEGYVTESDAAITVVLDTHMTDELLEEGFVRELVSKIQTMRKEAGFEVTDHIDVVYEAGQKAAEIFEKYGDQIGGEVLAESVKPGSEGEYAKEWNINGEKVTLAVTRR